MRAGGISSHYDINLLNLSRRPDYFAPTGCKLRVSLHADGAGGRPERPLRVRRMKLLTRRPGLRHPGQQPGPAA